MVYFIVIIAKKRLQIVLKNNSKRNSKPLPYITCVATKNKKCYPININYDKFEKYILSIVKKMCRNYADKEILASIYEKKQNKSLDIVNKTAKEIEVIDKSILEIKNNLDKMYLDKLKGFLQEEDYIRLSQKIDTERKKLVAYKKELSEKMGNIDKEMESKAGEEIELDGLINDFLNFDKIEKIYLYRLINRIEIDKNKNIYIYFNFSNK